MWIRWSTAILLPFTIAAFSLPGRAAEDLKPADPKTAAAPASDPIRERIDRAKASYAQSLEHLKADLLEDLDAKERQARGKGDKTLVDQIKAERAAFTEHDELPKVVPTVAYEKKLRQANMDIEAAFAAAIRDYTRAKRDTDATAAQHELETLRAEAAFGGAVDLLAMIDVERDASPNAKFVRQGKAIRTETKKGFRFLRVPYHPPAEYEIELVAKRIAGDNDIEIGAISGGNLFFALFDGWASTISGISSIDGKGANQNETTRRGKVFNDKGDPTRIVLTVHASAIRATADGKELFVYKGKPDRLTGANPNRGQRDQLILVIADNASYQIDSLKLKPISGRGERVK